MVECTARVHFEMNLCSVLLLRIFKHTLHWAMVVRVCLLLLVFLLETKESPQLQSFRFDSTVCLCSQAKVLNGMTVQKWPPDQTHHAMIVSMATSLTEAQTENHTKDCSRFEENLKPIQFSQSFHLSWLASPPSFRFKLTESWYSLFKLASAKWLISSRADIVKLPWERY